MANWALKEGFSDLNLMTFTRANSNGMNGKVLLLPPMSMSVIVIVHV